ncbi:DNA-3-methyladenine glycosylase [Falsibacillus albus]|uniref:Putative 3-methyladenine DNA glycosylase n=1 Tax=Falsibacillus albus TaxID=2478915 RepID=A0A3L7K1K5_9BACI|nr:DNA-3-methyladenine glycosylase [Falsibacillus albus]RLQ96234.1 DNA-3-methyladenine glycosylase [Falsibacillus albus]
MTIDIHYKPLPRDFYGQPTLKLAQSLLGALLVSMTPDGSASGYIVETEAYIGPHDRAAHSYNNRRTKRTEMMFHRAGKVYTFVMHTHCLVNVVSGKLEQPEAVLIRAVEPYAGIDLMCNRRKMPFGKNLTNGPGKLTKALGITMEQYGHDFSHPPLFLAEGIQPGKIFSGPRIGIGNSGEAKEYPWRYWIANNPFVSK